jgi:hypothetical protein
VLEQLDGKQVMVGCIDLSDMAVEAAKLLGAEFGASQAA